MKLFFTFLCSYKTKSRSNVAYYIHAYNIMHEVPNIVNEIGSLKKINNCTFCQV